LTQSIYTTTPTPTWPSTNSSWKKSSWNNSPTWSQWSKISRKTRVWNMTFFMIVVDFIVILFFI